MKFHPYGFFGGLRFGGIWKGGRGRVRGISRCQKCSGISRNLGFLFPSGVPIGCLGGRSDGAVFSNFISDYGGQIYGYIFVEDIK